MAHGWAGADPDEDADTADYELGVEMVANVDITITHVRIFGTPNAESQAARQGKIWNTTTGAVLATATMPDALTAGWNNYELSAPLERLTGERWLVSYATGGRYGEILGALNADVTSGDGAVTFLSNANATAGNGRINNTPGSYPTTATAGIFWGTDVEYTLGVGNTAPVIDSMAVTASGLTVTATITASDAETLVGATYLIDWGDGSTTASASGNHTYASSGPKAVLGSVTDAGGLSDHRASAIVLVDPPADGADVPAIIAALESHALSLGMFANVNGFEPKAAPSNGLHGALWVDDLAPPPRRNGLSATSLRLAFHFRISLPMMTEPQDSIDPTILVAVMALMRAYSGDFSLGGEAAFIDLLGAHGAPLAARAGYLNQDSRMFRVMVLAIPIILNDVFDQAP